jgi:hypothetical protein
VHSTTGLTVRNLKFFVATADRIPTTTPANREKKLKLMNAPRILKGVEAENWLSGPANSITVLKRMIQTASLVIPSPKTKENSLGYSSYLMTAIAATTSVQQRREHMRRISMMLRVNCSYSLYSRSTIKK